MSELTAEPAPRIRSFICDGETLIQSHTNPIAEGGTGYGQQLALGTYQGMPYVYMGTQGINNFWQFPADLSVATPTSL